MDCDELIPERSNFVNAVVDSEALSLNISRETLQQNKILRVIKMNLVKLCIEMIEETANQNDDYKKLSEQFGKCTKPCDHEIPQERIVEQITDVHVPQKGSFEKTGEQIMDVQVHQAMEEIGEAFELIPQECVKQCTVKQTDDQKEQHLQDNQQQSARQAGRKERGK